MVHIVCVNDWFSKHMRVIKCTYISRNREVTLLCAFICVCIVVRNIYHCNNQLRGTHNQHNLGYINIKAIEKHVHKTGILLEIEVNFCMNTCLKICMFLILICIYSGHNICPIALHCTMNPNSSPNQHR